MIVSKWNKHLGLAIALNSIIPATQRPSPVSVENDVGIKERLQNDSLNEVDGARVERNRACAPEGENIKGEEYPEQQHPTRHSALS